MLVSQTSTISQIYRVANAFIRRNELIFCWQLADPGCQEAVGGHAPGCRDLKRVTLIDESAESTESASMQYTNC